ncbi:XRE family transcriptional regulator [uncultured Pseudacidovorax sp.]|uniref:XRE family transcriptional regulator n=1 Tax=uncultured Pseudacidovorax sp. TaxID=679313 RepID=UPI0025EC31AE|nr:XRE family transcriptional regulator [uncultured Pseudacidovorax sp.]
MLTGKELGAAIRAAIERKGVTQREVADFFGVKPPSVSDWINKGTIGKDKLVKLWQYFDEVGPEHWGMSSFPTPPKALDSDFLPGFEKLAVPVLANSGSMGGGDDSLHEEIITGSLPVSPEWALRTLKPTGLQNLRFIHGYGDSMKGTYEDGDILLVDIGVIEPKIDGVYVLEANDRIYIKRVRQRLDGMFEISSDNPAVRTVDVLNGSAMVKCHGRVLWAWNGKRL